MRHHPSLPTLLSLGMLVVFSVQAFAQYYNHNYGTGNVLSQNLPFSTNALSSNSATDRFFTDLIPAALGFVIGAFFSPLLRDFRRAIFGVLLLIAVFYAWLGPPPIADWMTDIIAVFAFFFALGYGLRLDTPSAFARRQEEERPTSFGSAKWATQSYLHDHGLFDGKGFWLGFFDSNERRNLLRYSGDRHLLTVAPTRSGKGVSSIIPNLLTYKGSAFVIDPKGENALITAARRGRGNSAQNIPGLGQKIYLLDPWNIAAHELGITPACFNPLDWIRPDDPDAAENAFLLADALVSGQAEGETRFWDEEAKALLTGLILYVATSTRETESRHLGRVRDILLLDGLALKHFLEDMFQEPNPIVASTASRTAGKDSELLSNVLASTQSHTHFLDSPRIRESLSRSDFSFDDIKKKPMTVYLILPADRLQTFGRWLRLLIQQAVTVTARDITVRPERPVLYLLDEMPALGRLSMIEQAFGLMAGFGIQLWGIVQDLSQLERIYGKGWQTFISNSGVIQYFGSRDKMTAEYFSTLCGVTTVRSKTLSYALGRVFGTSSSSTSGTGNNFSSTSGSNESTSHTSTLGSNESQRQLAYPDELMVLKGDSQLIFVENLDPIHGTKLSWYDDPKLKKLGVNRHAVQSSPSVPRLESSLEPPLQKDGV